MQVRNKYSHKFWTLKFNLKSKIRTYSTLLGYFVKPKTWIFKIELCNPIAKARIVDERFLTKMLSEIMQSMKNAKHQLNKLAWPRRRADKLSAAAALRPSTLGGGMPRNSWRPGQRSTLGLHSSLVTQSQPYNYESIWLDPFINITFAISTLKYTYF